MTDYELVNLLLTQVQTMFEVLATYITVVSGFLVVGYLVAHKLHRSMVAVLVVLFSMASLACGLNARAMLGGASNTMAHVGEALAAGTSHVGWWFGGAPSPAYSIVPLIIQSIFVVAYIGALLFFFLQRRAGLKAAA